MAPVYHYTYRGEQQMSDEPLVPLGTVEVRFSGVPGTAEVRADSGGMTIAGLGSVADVETEIDGYYMESFAPDCWDRSIAEADVRSMFNHDTNLLLGRTKPGTLRLSTDAAGLHYEVDINPDDPQAVGVHARVARGDVDGASVWFRVLRQEVDYSGDITTRRILEAQLFEVGPVTFPAYEATTAQARSFAPVLAAMSAVGVKPAKRARIMADVLAGEDLSSEIRQLFARTPQLREDVCGCELGEGDRSAHVDADQSLLVPSDLALARARLMLRRSPAIGQR